MNKIVENNVKPTASSIRNFKNNQEVQNFYRFVYENDLRHEALKILSYYLKTRSSRKKNNTNLQ